ncbi:hypothetical protein BKA65DRAFT_481496 [Rhexocercosporidium sp. MPI-PUGE-AT-0058]|nr:hypothetical protein BKA65DRAFT_481496 [Rhexocercosporidium sp. MPI-PUGE-AT-0058]
MRDEKQPLTQGKGYLTAGEVLWISHLSFCASNSRHPGKPCGVLVGDEEVGGFRVTSLVRSDVDSMRLHRCSIGSAASIEGSQDRIKNDGSGKKVEDGEEEEPKLKFTRNQHKTDNKDELSRTGVKSLCFSFFGDGLHSTTTWSSGSRRAEAGRGGRDVRMVARATRLCWKMWTCTLLDPTFLQSCSAYGHATQVRASNMREGEVFLCRPSAGRWIHILIFILVCNCWGGVGFGFVARHGLHSSLAYRYIKYVQDDVDAGGSDEISASTLGGRVQDLGNKEYRSVSIVSLVMSVGAHQNNSWPSPSTNQESESCCN